MVDAGTFRSGQARWKGPKFQKSSFFIAEALSLPAESERCHVTFVDRQDPDQSIFRGEAIRVKIKAATGSITHRRWSSSGKVYAIP